MISGYFLQFYIERVIQFTNVEAHTSRKDVSRQRPHHNFIWSLPPWYMNIRDFCVQLLHRREAEPWIINYVIQSVAIEVPVFPTLLRTSAILGHFCTNNVRKSLIARRMMNC